MLCPTFDRTRALEMSTLEAPQERNVVAISVSPVKVVPGGPDLDGPEHEHTWEIHAPAGWIAAAVPQGHPL
jgi:hypothetical protein